VKLALHRARDIEEAAQRLRNMRMCVGTSIERACRVLLNLYRNARLQTHPPTMQPRSRHTFASALSSANQCFLRVSHSSPLTRPRGMWSQAYCNRCVIVVRVVELDAAFAVEKLTNKRAKADACEGGQS
jgi:hypothetical protein